MCLRVRACMQVLLKCVLACQPAGLFVIVLVALLYSCVCTHACACVGVPAFLRLLSQVFLCFNTDRKRVGRCGCVKGVKLQSFYGGRVYVRARTCVHACVSTSTACLAGGAWACLLLWSKSPRGLDVGGFWGLGLGWTGLDVSDCGVRSGVMLTFFLSLPGDQREGSKPQCKVAQGILI